MNSIETAKRQAAQLVRRAYERAVEEGALPQAPVPERIPVEVPKDTRFGDYSTSFAMQMAKALRQPPRQIAQTIADRLELAGSYFATVSIAGAGFINLTLGKEWFGEVVRGVLAEGKDYGRIQADKPEKIMVEFVSANPTGPMHMGNARGGVLGDCLAEILTWAGHDVSREFLINDAGNQVELFGRSLDARYQQALYGEDACEFPEDGYHGDDIRALAQQLKDEQGDGLMQLDEQERRRRMVEYGLKNNIARMQRDLERYHIHYDRWFHETELHESGYVRDTVELLTQKGMTYEKDGAIWLRSTDFGCEKDDVLRRANGFYTYFAADIAYHRNKLEVRGFDRAINIWGADHHGHVKRLQCALDALGLDGSHRLEIVLMQLVRLTQGGEVVRMSKRTGKSITLSDLLDEVPVDAARFFFNSREATTHLEFDLDLAVRQDSDNPVYYVQYAHARICSVLRTLAQDGVALLPPEQIDFSVLEHEEEINLIKALSRLPEEIRLGARDRDPSVLNKYAVSLAAQFHRFYNNCRIREAESAVRQARLALCAATQQTIANVLTIIGVHAPENM